MSVCGVAVADSRCSVELIIGCFLGDDDIVDMAFAQSSTGNADETGALAQILDGTATTIAHTRAQPTDQLIHHIGQGAFVGDTPFIALRYQLAGLRLVALEIAVAFPSCHGAERTHSAVDLVTPALVQNALAWALLGPGKEAADHHGVGPSRQGLDDIPGVFDAPV